MSIQECSVCLSVLIDDNDKRVLPCMHCFHASCVDRWIKTNPTCPECKHSTLDLGTQAAMKESLAGDNKTQSALARKRKVFVPADLDKQTLFDIHWDIETQKALAASQKQHEEEERKKREAKRLCLEYNGNTDERGSLLAALYGDIIDLTNE